MNKPEDVDAVVAAGIASGGPIDAVVDDYKERHPEASYEEAYELVDNVVPKFQYTVRAAAARSDAIW